MHNRQQWIVPALVLFIGGCATDAKFNDVYTQITPPQLQAGQPIPLPNSEPILKVTGRLGNTNQDDHIIMDRQTIESLGLVEYSVLDLFEQQNHIFRGVLMRDLLDLWQVDSQATTLNLKALNDYNIQVPIIWLKQYPVLFALQQDGKNMQSDYRGPAMLVFPYQQFPSVSEFAEESYWIWQIAEINVQ
ncbi:molybdopterin-dependent oxidoreductase [Acaryochloris sp. CCMEE 5410]|uniref:molybdopterin-dependent oxidoreductase n=1 Tax=Acaryochloris sp. CCMEE 5410 TaxID=310037 RepID=UPI0002484D22|nr:molybdopterin-dependent oxidoreductase [Acaryochloris sp. CCMEE 5410]